VKDLAPHITRQRLLVEGLYTIEVDRGAVDRYLHGVAAHLGLRTYGAATIFSPGGEGKAENQVVLVADMDMLADSAAVEVQEVFGQKVLVPRNGNLNFLQSLVEQFAGDNALTSLRSRAAFSKPLTVVQDLAMDAQRRYLGKIKELEDSLIQTNEKLQALQRGRTGAQAGVLSAEQQTEIENFKQNAIAMRRDLKEVRKELRAEIETLEFWTKVVNIGLVPVLVSLAGLVFYLARRRRQDRKG